MLSSDKNHDIISIKPPSIEMFIIPTASDIVICDTCKSNTCPFHGNLHPVKSSRVHYYELSFSGNAAVL